MLTNDNDVEGMGSGQPSLEAQGQAALILVESLIHVLKERSVLTSADSLDVLTTAIEVQEDHARDAGAQGAELWRAHALLSRIARSVQLAA